MTDQSDPENDETSFVETREELSKRVDETTDELEPASPNEGSGDDSETDSSADHLENRSTESEPDTASDTSGGRGIREAQTVVRNTAANMIGRPLDGIIEITPAPPDTDENETWHVVIEVIERRSVPDTQDILGRYTVVVDETGAIIEYDRLGRYRRGDMNS